MNLLGTGLFIAVIVLVVYFIFFKGVDDRMGIGNKTPQRLQDKFSGQDQGLYDNN